MSTSNKQRRARNAIRKAAERKGRGLAMTPGFASREPLPLREIPNHPQIETILVTSGQNSYLRTYVLGECSCQVSREYGKWHLSVAHRSRDPTWREISEAWYRLVPGAGRPDGPRGALPLPALNEYINLHQFCFQVFEV